LHRGIVKQPEGHRGIREHGGEAVPYAGMTPPPMDKDDRIPPVRQDGGTPPLRVQRFITHDPMSDAM